MKKKASPPPVKEVKKDNFKRILLILLILFWPAGLIYYFVKRQNIKDIKEDNWFLDHPFLTWLIILFSIIILLVIITPDDQSYPTDNNKATTVQKTYVNESLTKLILKYVSSSSMMTDMQKEESFKQIRGKYIRDKGIVTEVSESFGTPIVAIMNPENEFLSGATIYFKKTEKDKLLDVRKYNSIKFEGKIESYNSLLGIIIHDAIIFNS